MGILLRFAIMNPASTPSVNSWYLEIRDRGVSSSLSATNHASHANAMQIYANASAAG